MPVIDGEEQFKAPERSRALSLAAWDDGDISDLGEIERDHDNKPVKWGPYPLSVGGRMVKPIQLRVFSAWVGGAKTLRSVADAHGVKWITAQHWKYQAWWKVWSEIWFQKANEDLQVAIASRDEALIDQYEAIIRGDNPTSKIANAQVQAMNMRMQMGRDPIINKRPVHTTINAIQNNMQISTPERIAEMARKDPSKIREWMATGNKPVELSNEHQESKEE